MMKTKSHKKILNKKVSKIDPWWTRIQFLSVSCMLDLFWFFVSNLSISFCTNLSESILNPCALILQLIGLVRGNQMSWKDPKGVPQIFLDYRLPISISQALTKDIAER